MNSIVVTLILSLVSVALATDKGHDGWKMRQDNEDELAKGKLRGTSVHADQHHQPIVALQARHSTHLQSKHSLERAAKRKARKIARSKASYFTGLLASLRQRAEHKQEQMHKHKRVNLCNGNRYGWMVEIRQACKDSFGDASAWDQSLGEGACTQAWEECNSDFAGQCCTQVEGPRNMEAYCARSENANDRACAVQGRMRDVQDTMHGIRDGIGLMNTAGPPAGPPHLFTLISGDCVIVDGGRCVTSPGFPEDYSDDEECEIKAPSRGVVYPRVKLVAEVWSTESCCDKLSVMDERFSGESMEEDGPDVELEGGPTMTWSTDFSAPGTGWKVCAEDIPPAPAPPPPALCLQDKFPIAGAPAHAPGAAPGPAPAPVHPDQVWVPCPAPAPAPSAPALPAHQHSPAWYAAHPKAHGPPKPTMLEMQCMKISELVRKASESIHDIGTWSEREGIVQPRQGTAPRQAHGASLLMTMAHVAFGSRNAGTSEAKDPDLTFAVDRVLSVGDRLNHIRNNPLCGRAGAPAAVPEDDDDDESADDTTDDEAEEAAEEPEEATKVNGSAVGELLNFEEGMEDAVGNFEGAVHPHGRKWWRYRYQYTLVESLVLAFSVMLLYLVMWLLAGASFFDKFKFYNIGLTTRLFRYAWAYFLFHATALMVMVCSAWMLYMPWGEVNAFDIFATAFHGWVGDRANVPFLGHSWLLMVLNVQFQLFVTFGLYGLFIVIVTVNWSRALNDWRALMLNPSKSEAKNLKNVILGGCVTLATNEYHFKEFSEIMTHRVANHPSFRSLFGEKRLRFAAVEGIDSQRQQGFHDFQLHILLTDTFGRALEYLVEVSLKANSVLAICSLAVAGLAYYYQVAFMYFLPLFVAGGLVLFIFSWFLTRNLRDHNHDHSLDYLTVHAYCRAIQLTLYCVFFSFSRLLLSADIFTDFPRVYLSAFIGLVATLLLAYFVLGELMKATIMRITLPHHSQEDRFGMHLQSVAYWHTVANCHECGVRQHPPNACLNREWAGTNVGLATSAGSPRTDSAQGSHRRDYSFR